ncbi:hypothetical protein KCU74_g39, partial [Aureobasidium melanogenum]
MRDDFSEPVALGSQPSSMTYHRSMDTVLLLNTIVRHHGYEHCTMDFHTPKAAIVTRDLECRIVISHNKESNKACGHEKMP